MWDWHCCGSENFWLKQSSKKSVGNLWQSFSMALHTWGYGYSPTRCWLRLADSATPSTSTVTTSCKKHDRRGNCMRTDKCFISPLQHHIWPSFGCHARPSRSEQHCYVYTQSSVSQHPWCRLLFPHTRSCGEKGECTSFEWVHHGLD